MKTLSRTFAVAGCTALFTAVAGATAAHAASVIVPETGTLLAGGAGASFSVTFDCDAGQDADVFVRVAQKVGDQHAATGAGFSDIVTCADGAETAETAVLAAGDFAFTEGDALVEISLTTCDTVTCEVVTEIGVARFG